MREMLRHGSLSVRMRGFRTPIVGFLALAYLWSWGWWSVILLGLALGDAGSSAPHWRGVPYWMIGLAVIGGWGPTLAALVVTAAIEGKEGVRALLRRCLVWRLAVRWHLVAWLLPPLMMAAGLLIFLALGHRAGAFVPGRWSAALLMLAIGLPLGPMAEELGWRGFLLPRLQQSFNALQSSLLIGVLWCFWHAPLFWAPMGTTVSGALVTTGAVAKYLAYVTALSVIFTWLLNGTGGSLLLVIVFHLTVNADLVTQFFPQLSAGDIRSVRELSTIPLWAVALTLIAVHGPESLSRHRE
jgi:membrane protease YdiL (CAAX protease family)